MPIRAEDLRDIRRYKLAKTHTKHDGSEIWTAPVTHESTGNAMTNEYFYRAMSLEELDSYRNKFTFAKSLNGHQGWAPYRAYSLGYLDESAPRLVEVKLPGFVAAMKAQGWISGKAEKGCLSWGIGTKQSNSWQGGAGRPRSKADALEPWDIFHNCLYAAGMAAVRVVNVLGRPA